MGSTVGTLLLLGSSGEPETSVSSTGVSILAALGAAVGLWASTPRGIAPSGDDVDQEKPEDQEEDSIYNDFNMTNDVMRSQNDSNNNGYTRTAENELSRGANLRGDSNQSALGELEVDDVLIPR
uniref:Uncharacterized protein n=1 Tax=Entomoneis paludosa TaxID=265537 RepID=A0A7S2Y196_9STRA